MVAVAVASSPANSGMGACRRTGAVQGSSGMRVCTCTCTKLAQQQVIDAGVHADEATTAANVSACPPPGHSHSRALDPPARPVICTAPAGTCSTKRALMRARRLHMRWYRGMPLCTRVCKSARERRNRTAIVKTAVVQHARVSGLRTPAVLTVAVPLHLSSADLPTRVHKAVTQIRRTCNRRTYMSAHLVEHVLACAVQMTGRIGGSSVHVQFAAGVAVFARSCIYHLSVRELRAVHVRTCMPDEPCAVSARRVGLGPYTHHKGPGHYRALYPL